MKNFTPLKLKKKKKTNKIIIIGNFVLLLVISLVWVLHYNKYLLTTQEKAVGPKWKGPVPNKKFKEVGKGQVAEGCVVESIEEVTTTPGVIGHKWTALGRLENCGRKSDRKNQTIAQAPTNTPTLPPTATPTPTKTPTPTIIPTETPIPTSIPTETPTLIETPTETPTITLTITPNITNTINPSATPTEIILAQSTSTSTPVPPVSGAITVQSVLMYLIPLTIISLGILL